MSGELVGVIVGAGIAGGVAFALRLMDLLKEKRDVYRQSVDAAQDALYSSAVSLDLYVYALKHYCNEVNDGEQLRSQVMRDMNHFLRLNSRLGSDYLPRGERWAKAAAAVQLAVENNSSNVAPVDEARHQSFRDVNDELIALSRKRSWWCILLLP